MSNFRVRLNDAAKIICTTDSGLKDRLYLAVTNQLLLANVPVDENVPEYFRKKLTELLLAVSTKGWNENMNTDKVRATLHGKHGKTLSKWAETIWDLHREYECYEMTGFIPR